MKKIVIAITMALLMTAGSLELAAAAGGPGKGNGGGRSWCSAAGQPNAGCPRNSCRAGTGRGSQANPNCPYRAK